MLFNLFMGHPHAVIMPQTKNIQGKFYPLQHEELINLNKRLTASELSVYLWLKTNEPFGDKLVEADTKTIAIDLNISRRSVQRALVKLRKEKLIDLVITKFHYRVRSKSAESSPNTNEDSDNPNENSNNTSEVKEKLRVATSVSPDDISVAKVTSMSSSVRECRHRYENVAIGTPMSPPSAETQSEQESQNPKTIKTYSDFKRSLSESARENFFNYVKEKTKNLEKPINDLEAWLASKNAANQNRWEVYYQNYQNYTRFTNSRDNRNSSPSRRQKILQWQEYLRQEKLAAARLQKESEILQRTSKQKSQTEHITEQNNSEPTTQQNNLNQDEREFDERPRADERRKGTREFNLKSPKTETESTTEQISPNHDSESSQEDLTKKCDQILNNPRGCTKNPSLSSPTDPSSERKINRNQARKILRDVDLRQRLENNQDPDLGGES